MRLSYIPRNIVSCADGFLISLLRGRRLYPSTPSVQSFVKTIDYNFADAKTLDLGCGLHPRNPFGADVVFGVDVVDINSNNIHKADLSIEQIPFPDNTFQFCTAFDFLEHIPRLSWPQGVKRLSFIELFNEIHRVLAPEVSFCISSQRIQQMTLSRSDACQLHDRITIPDYFCKRMFVLNICTGSINSSP